MRYLALIMVCVTVLACSPQQQQSVQEFDNVLIYPKTKLLPEFKLTDQFGDEFGNSQLQGKWTLFFIGYTYCPDICPTTLMDLNRIYPQLQQLSQPVQVVLITADPARDSSERLKEYIGFFNSEFTAVRAEHAELFPFSRALNLVYAVSDSKQNDYLVNHSASLSLVNPAGELQAIIKPDFSAKPAQIDFPQIVKVIDTLIKN
ncbi:SCO family protein [Catenovulum sp. SX2]|uniref:SCO family protein n=1 Tax=Catenovulum sp. SX2 TaxID=3398614 RepID=UPI003F854C82